MLHARIVRFDVTDTVALFFEVFLELNTRLKNHCTNVVFSSTPIFKKLLQYLSHRMFAAVHGALNVDEKKN